jgi:microcystin-dependent protein
MNDENIMGSIMLFAGNFAPQGWAYCNGATLEIQQYEALYAILGNMYGGDGSSDFKLPNLIGPVSTGNSSPITINYIICIEGIFPSRS